MQKPCPSRATGTDVDVSAGVQRWSLPRLASGTVLLFVGAATGLLAPTRVVLAQGVGGCPGPLPASGDTTASRPETSPGKSPTPDAPDVILFASVTARTLRFNSPPQARVRFCWDGSGDTLRVIERRNLPSPIVAGVTYRDVYVAVELRGHLNPECLLRARSTSDTTGPAVSPSLLSACAAMSLRPAVQRDSQPRPPPR